MENFEKFLKNFCTGFARLFAIVILINIGDGLYDLSKQPIWVIAVVVYVFSMVLGEH